MGDSELGVVLERARRSGNRRRVGTPSASNKCLDLVSALRLFFACQIDNISSDILVFDPS